MDRGRVCVRGSCECAGEASGCRCKCGCAECACDCGWRVEAAVCMRAMDAHPQYGAGAVAGCDRRARTTERRPTVVAARSACCCTVRACCRMLAVRERIMPCCAASAREDRETVESHSASACISDQPVEQRCGAKLSASLLLQRTVHTLAMEMRSDATSRRGSIGHTHARAERAPAKTSHAWSPSSQHPPFLAPHAMHASPTDARALTARLHCALLCALVLPTLPPWRDRGARQ